MMILLLVCLSAQLPRFGAAYPLKSVYQESQRYGNSGNSFVCAVEFGDKVKAKSLLAGNSSDPKSKHFNDQSEMYQKGNSKTCFYKEIEKQSERKYHPGE
jgi:acyl-homoserine lactone acylase PvdQ